MPIGLSGSAEAEERQDGEDDDDQADQIDDPVHFEFSVMLLLPDVQPGNREFVPTVSGLDAAVRPDAAESRSGPAVSCCAATARR
jgi:hypothetical protein